MRPGRCRGSTSEDAPVETVPPAGVRRLPIRKRMMIHGGGHEGTARPVVVRPRARRGCGRRRRDAVRVGPSAEMAGSERRGRGAWRTRSRRRPWRTASVTFFEPSCRPPAKEATVADPGDIRGVAKIATEGRLGRVGSVAEGKRSDRKSVRLGANGAPQNLGVEEDS